MASDPIARPLSGISQADIIVEMPVTLNGITRIMAIFQCEPFGNAQGGESFEIGSIRSAREDFLTFVTNFNAIYAHWGGEAGALKKLDNGILDNIDAMKYEGTVFYRKNSVPRPHNGFTTIELLEDKAEDLGYDLNNSFAGFIRDNDRPERNLSNLANSILIDYASPYNVEWAYDENENVYNRKKGGEAELDRNTGEQVKASVVVLMRTASKVLSVDYISVKTTGEGEAEFYQNGIKTSGVWRNNNNDLKFYDATGQEMKFVPGKMWMHFVTK